MVRGEGPTTKVHYKGASDDFVIYVDSAEVVQKWLKDRSIPLAQVVDGWKIFCTHKQGVQGILDAASNSALDSEFGTHKEEDVVIQILEKGEVQEGKSSGKEGERNPSKGQSVSSGNTGVHN